MDKLTPIRVVLAIFNFILIIFAVISIIVGILVMWQATNLLELIGMADSLKSGSVGEDAFVVMEENQWLFKVAGGSMMALGIFITIVAIVGFVGFVKSWSFLLYLYCFLVGLLTIVKVVVIIFVAAKKSSMESMLSSSIVSKMKSHHIPSQAFGGAKNHSTVQNAVTSFVNVFQMKYNCCMVKDEKVLAKSEWQKRAGGNTVPASCCQLVISNDDKKRLYRGLHWEKIHLALLDSNCVKDMSSAYEARCPAVIAKMLQPKLTITLILLSAMVLLEIVLIVLSLLAAQKDEAVTVAY